MQTKMLDDLAQRLADALPPGLSSAKSEFERTARVVLQTALQRMNLVSREEFEVQRAVLATTRAKVEELERQLAELDTRLRQPPA